MTLAKDADYTRAQQGVNRYISRNLSFNPAATIKVGNPYNQGTDYGWRDLVGDIVIKGVGAADPSWEEITGMTGMFAYAFSATVNKECWVSYHVDHDYAEGTPIYLHTHWLNAAASPNTGTVRWGFQYTFAKGHQQTAFPTPTTVYKTQTCDSTRYMHHIAEVDIADAIPGTDIEPDTIIMVRVFRDAVTDTCTDKVSLIKADCHYQACRFATLNKAPNFNEYA